MSLPNKNSNLAIVVTVAISTMLISAVAQADPNPYLEGNRGVESNQESGTLDRQIAQKKPEIKVINKKKILSPGSGIQTGKDAFVKEGGPIFVKDGGKLPGVEKIRTLPGSGVQTGKGAFVKESGPIFVKDGGKLPGIERIQNNGIKSNPKSIPSAVNIEKKLKSTEQ
jgi:hypothetical protein